MTIVATNQITVLEAVVARLIDQVDELTSKNCFISLDPYPPANVIDSVFCTVAPTEGNFDDGALEGGGEFTCFESSGVVVTIFSKMKLDRSGLATELLTSTTRGLLFLKQEILKALTSYQLTSGSNDLLVNFMQPLGAASAVQENNLGSLSITFSTDFQWDLT